MSQLKAFIEKAQSDKELMAKLDELGAKDAGVDEVIALAKENGFTITADEIEKMKDGGEESGELAEEDLEAVAGGAWPTANRYDSSCKNMKTTKYNCVGFLSKVWCDHYSMTQIGKKETMIVLRYWHRCAMNGFPEYRGNYHGTPK